MCLVGVGVEPELERTSQQLTATRVTLRLRERLKVPEVKNGNPSDSKAETIVEVKQWASRPGCSYFPMLFGRALTRLGRSIKGE